MDGNRGPTVAEALADARREIEHRIQAHTAALRAADALGWPSILSTAVADTEARLDEAQTCLAAIDRAAAWALAESAP